MVWLPSFTRHDVPTNPIEKASYLMFHKVREYLDQRQARKNAKAYSEGYAWACTAIGIDNKSRNEVDAYIGNFRTHAVANMDLFDRGAQRALEDMESGHDKGHLGPSPGQIFRPRRRPCFVRHRPPVPASQKLSNRGLGHGEGATAMAMDEAGGPGRPGPGHAAD